MAAGLRLVVATLVLVVCDAVGGLLAVVSGVSTWGEAWGFDTDFTVPLPIGLAQLLLAWLAARSTRPRVGLVAAVVLAAFCLVSFLFGLLDGDLTSSVATSWGAWGAVWGVVLLTVTAVVGLLAAARARQLRRGD